MSLIHTTTPSPHRTRLGPLHADPSTETHRGVNTSSRAGTRFQDRPSRAECVGQRVQSEQHSCRMQTRAASAAKQAAWCLVTSPSQQFGDTSAAFSKEEYSYAFHDQRTKMHGTKFKRTKSFAFQLHITYPLGPCKLYEAIPIAKMTK